jgi:hypothetical protein
VGYSIRKISLVIDEDPAGVDGVLLELVEARA